MSVFLYKLLYVLTNATGQKIGICCLGITRRDCVGIYHVSGFGDPARMMVGQTGDKKTLDNIR
jgi:hypothetical protein